MRWPERGIARLRALAGAVAPLLSALLLLAAVAAPAHCLAELARLPGNGPALCAAEHAAPGPDRTDPAGLHHAGGICVGCPLAPLLASAGPQLAPVTVHWAAAAEPFAAPPIVNAAFSPGQPRGPPHP